MAEFALVCASHSPLMNFVEPPPGVRAKVDEAFAEARSFVADFDPDLVVLFGPDHYNGVFYDMMPPFCVGAAASSIGDWESTAGDVRVDRDVAYRILKTTLDADLDTTLSELLFVDHGFVQPLDLLFGGIDRVPVVPIFINSVAEPLGPPRRARLLGDAVGHALADLDRRILILGSGGLSHNPPAPRLEGATPEVAARLRGGGRRLTPAERAERERRVISTARDFANGVASIQPLNPGWDKDFLELTASGNVQAVDGWTTEWCAEQAGNSSHEVRTWVAAFAALAVQGPYDVTSNFYEPIEEWIAGFAIQHAVLTSPRQTR
jgi:2,3-dihydroxyphenylpropionate 1,2-dioxygenase